MKLSKKSLLVVSVMLFALFFGAGNLIFPPFLGQNAGENTLPAMIGFLATAVVLPVLGVVVVARFDGLEKLGKQVGARFALVFTVLIYLSIGPCLAIPRTASTSFAMLTPLLGSSAGLQLGYSVLFFGAAFLVALRPDRLTRWLGRLLCPCLLVLILILFGGCLLHPLAAQYGAPTDAYSSAVILQGVLYGYQTMDALAALNFGAVIAMNIRAQGVAREQDVQRSAIRTGLEQVRWPGRFELLRHSPAFLLDGSHNAHGMRATVQSLRDRFPGQKFVFLLLSLIHISEPTRP